MKLISSAQCRAARALLNWSQPDLAQNCGMHAQTISAFEKETGTPTKTTLEKIKLAFENKGIEFSKHDGVCKKEDLIIKYEGDNCFYRFLKDAYEEFKHSKSEILFSGEDERRSTEKSIQLTREILQAGTPIRWLIEKGNTEVMGNLNDYKWMPDGLFIDTDVKIIYGNCIAYLLSWHNDRKVIVIKDQAIAEEARRNFNFVWSLSKPVTHTTSKIRY